MLHEHAWEHIPFEDGVGLIDISDTFLLFSEESEGDIKLTCDGEILGASYMDKSSFVELKWRMKILIMLKF